MSLIPIYNEAMENELLDNEFYEEEAVSPVDWWEARRGKYNKICVKGGLIILAIAVLELLNSKSMQGILFVFYFAFGYWVAGNILYTLTWILEKFINQAAKIKVEERTRNIIFWTGVAVTYLIPLLLLLFLSLMINSDF